MGDIRITRVYDSPTPADGCRVLVDRLWPRGVSRERASLDVWLKDVAPTPQLRTWWDHDPAHLAEFTRRYRAELDGNAAVDALRRLVREHARVTLVYAARDSAVNHAAVLRDYLSAHEPEGGDAACWLVQTCPECGALNEKPGAACWRCGAPRPSEEA